MTNQADLFAWDAKEGDRLKKEGMALASSNRGEYFRYAQSVARGLARKKVDRELNYDDVFFELQSRGDNPLRLGNAAGDIFSSDPAWVFTGKRLKSRRVSNHGREIKVWRLR